MKITLDWKAPVGLPFLKTNFPVGSWAKFGEAIFIIQSWDDPQLTGTAIQINADNGKISLTTVFQNGAAIATRITPPSEINLHW